MFETTKLKKINIVFLQKSHNDDFNEADWCSGGEGVYKSWHSPKYWYGDPLFQEF